MKPVTFHVKWPNIPETKTEIGTEMSAPVSMLSFPLFDGWPLMTSCNS